MLITSLWGAGPLMVVLKASHAAFASNGTLWPPTARDCVETIAASYVEDVRPTRLDVDVPLISLVGFLGRFYPVSTF